MYSRVARASRAVSLALAVFALTGAGILLTWDALPARFPGAGHAFLAAAPLVMIGVAYLVYQGAHRCPLREWIKAIMLAAAFLFWAANQLWPDSSRAVLFNDIAIGFFVLDVFLVMISRSQVAQHKSAQTRTRENSYAGIEEGSASFATKLQDDGN
jgi:hypothetical protein